MYCIALYKIAKIFLMKIICLSFNVVISSNAQILQAIVFFEIQRFWKFKGLIGEGKVLIERMKFDGQKT